MLEALTTPPECRGDTSAELARRIVAYIVEAAQTPENSSATTPDTKSLVLPPPDTKFGERAMQLITAVMSSGRPGAEILERIQIVVDAWVFHPAILTPDVMIEELPRRQT